MIKQVMKSPFSGGNAVLRCEPSTLTFRKEEFCYIHQFYECEDTHERFTTTELDEANLAQVYNQYRAILGFGENQYRLYENGDMPSEANGKVLMSIMNPDFFLAFVLNSREQFSEDDFSKLMEKTKSWKSAKHSEFEVEHVFNICRRTIYNGFATQSIDKLKNILLYFIERGDGVFFTKMNKLLFYTDFLAYRLTGKGMTGLCYKAIAHGPVPLHWDRVYSFYNDISQEIVQYPDGRAGTKLVSNLSPDMTYFSEDEKEMLEYVYQRFKKETPTQISETSHHEDAWKKYLNSDRLISFEMAFSLKAI